MEYEIIALLIITFFNTLAIMGTCTHQVIIHHIRKSNQNALILTNKIDDTEDIEKDGMQHTAKHRLTTLTINNTKQEEIDNSNSTTKVGKAAAISNKVKNVFSNKNKEKVIDTTSPAQDEDADVVGSSSGTSMMPITRVAMLKRGDTTNTSVENMKANAQVAIEGLRMFVQAVEANNADEGNSTQTTAITGETKVPEEV